MKRQRFSRAVVLAALAVALVALALAGVVGFSTVAVISSIHDRIPRVVLGLGVALGLAVLAAHPRLRKIEERLGITMLLSAGIPFLAMGAIFSREDVGILTPDVLADLRPAFEFGLGWMGFVVGINLDVRKFDRMHRSIGRVAAVASLVPMATTALLCSIVFVGLGVPWKNVEFARDALVLAACAAPSAPVSVEFLAQKMGAKAAGYVRDVTSLDELTWLPVLGLVAVYFRPEGIVTGWQLPAVAWLLVTMGLGGVLGILTYLLLRGARTVAEELALLLGAVALSAGISGYLALSVPVVCAIAGALLANLPMRDLEGFRKTLVDLERPLYLVFLLIVGASWRPGEWQGWVIACAFVLARVAGKRLGAIWSRRIGPSGLPSARRLAISLAPQSPVSVVAIISAATLYQGMASERVRWSINAVIIGGVLTEVVIRILERFEPPEPVAAPAAPAAVTPAVSPGVQGGAA